MNLFCKLPAWLRIAVAWGFLIAAVVIAIRGRPSVILAFASLALLVSGAWRLSRLRILMMLLIMIPLLIALLLAGFDWHHPFLARYSAALFSVIAVLLFMDTVRIEEWIDLLHRGGARLHLEHVSPILIGTAVGIVSLSAGIQEQRACRKLVGIYRWRAKSKTAVFLDSLSLAFYSAVESHEFIDEALHRWSHRWRDQEELGRAMAGSELEALSGLSFGNSIYTAQLIDVYDFPKFTELVPTLSRSAPFAESCETVLAGLTRGSAVLAINSRSECLIRRLLEAGLKVTAIEQVRSFRERLGAIQPEYCSSLAIVADMSQERLGNKRKFDCIIFGQHAFLEMLNETDSRVLLSRLFTMSTAEGRIFLTYPALETAGKAGSIFNGNVPGIGHICFQYAEYVRTGDMASAQLAYTVEQEHDAYFVRVLVRFKAPDLSSILRVAAEEAGFDHKISPISPGGALFWGDQIGVELCKRSLRSRSSSLYPEQGALEGT